LVTYTIKGVPTIEKLCAFFDAVAASPGFETGFAFLGDCRQFLGDPDVTLIRAVAKEIRARADKLGPCKWALVFSTPGGFGAVRVCSLLIHGSGIELESFMTVAEAETWLGAKTCGLKDGGFGS
jgi:hypothetical protein